MILFLQINDYVCKKSAFLRDRQHATEEIYAILNSLTHRVRTVNEFSAIEARYQDGASIGSRANRLNNEDCHLGGSDDHDDKRGFRLDHNHHPPRHHDDPSIDDHDTPYHYHDYHDDADYDDHDHLNNHHHYVDDDHHDTADHHDDGAGGRLVPNPHGRRLL